MKKVFLTVCVATLFSGTGCKSALSPDANIVEVTGTVRSSFENFSFTPNGGSESYWINDYNDETGQYYAKNWKLVDDIHQSLLKKESELIASKLPVPIIYICINGRAVIQSHQDGVGHLGGWKSDITFTDVKSAAVGQCDSSNSQN